MSTTRQDFEEWAAGVRESGIAWVSWEIWQAATSGQEAKIKALTDALRMYQKAGVGSCNTDFQAQWTAYTNSVAVLAAKETT